MKITERINKIQDLPLAKRKIIFWIIVIFIGLIMFAVWIFNINQTFKTLKDKQFLEKINFPDIKTEVQDLQEKLPVPEAVEQMKEQKETIEELLQQTENNQNQKTE